jgi:putative acetyltransferase
MHFRTVEPGDVIALAVLGKRMSTLPGHPWLAVECNEAVMSAWVNQCIDNGLMVVAEHPTIAGTLVGCVAAAKVGRQTQRHVWSELTLLIDPEFQGDALARSLLLLLLDEVVRHRPEVGKVEGWLPESAAEMITLLQELDFMIEGRAEMRRRNADKSYEADIALGWQNPAFEFEQD